MIMKDLSSKKDSKSSSFIRLSLRKPTDWKVALTTSVSSPALIPPDIQLWDAEKGNIIVDTSGQSTNYARRKFHSFGKSAESVDKDRSVSSKHRSNSDKTNISSSQLGGRYIRSKSSSGRVREDLVWPSDCVRPKTPVMVARRVSLSKDNYDVSHPEEPTLHPSGIATHHRKMHSDSLVDMRRRVKSNVSFGKVDHIEESGSVSSYNSENLKDIYQKRNSDARRPISGVVITEVCNSNNYDRPDLNITPSGRNALNVKYRSRSGIPTKTHNRRDSFSEGVVDNSCPLGRSIDPSSIVNGCSNRRSRMELHMQEGSERHKFNVVRVSDSGNPLSRPSSTSYREQKPHNDCDRGFCPLARYFDHTSSVQESLRKVELESNKSRNSWMDSTYGGSGNAITSSTDMKIPSKETGRRGREKQIKKREVSKGRKKRVPSRNREMMMSSSSSSEDEDHRSARMPPSRMRRSKPNSGSSPQ